MGQSEQEYVKYIGARGDSYWWCDSCCDHWAGCFWLHLEKTEVFNILYSSYIRIFAYLLYMDIGYNYQFLYKASWTFIWLLLAQS